MGCLDKENAFHMTVLKLCDLSVWPGFRIKDIEGHMRMIYYLRPETSVF